MTASRRMMNTILYARNCDQSVLCPSFHGDSSFAFPDVSNRWRAEEKRTEKRREKKEKEDLLV
jgi:hypothetical protein